MINNQVIEYIKKNGKATPKELSSSLKVSESSISKALNTLIAGGQLVKTGQGRSTSYQPASLMPAEETNLPSKARDIALEEPPAEVLADESKKQDMLTRWCNQLRVNPQLVSDWHSEFYKRLFGYSYETYRSGGMQGRLINILLWILAFGIVWIWSMATVRTRVIFILIALGAIVIAYQGYQRFQYTQVVQANDWQKAQKMAQIERQSRIDLEQIDKAQEEAQRLKQSNEQLQDRLDKAQNDAQRLNQQNNQWKEQLNITSEQIKDLRHQLQDKDVAMVRLNESIKKAQGSQNQMDQLSQENKRLREKFQNEQAINIDLDTKLQVALAKTCQDQGPRDMMIKFDENGDRIK